jgi:formate/nitrite transporter FocA (FNT family)
MAGQAKRPKAGSRKASPQTGETKGSGQTRGDGRQGFSASDAEDIEERQRLRAPLIYEILRREGEEEMNRPVSSLWWSGVAAGLSISFSLLSQAILQTHLPDQPWRPLVSDLGYPVGFLMVVLAQQQLFTENTVTVVLPVAASPTLANFGRLGRMWAIVLSANIAGTLFSALFCSFTPVLAPDIRAAMLDLSRQAIDVPPADLFFHGISAGFLIAAMAWLIPSAEGAKFLVITLMTYLIAIGGFAHIVAGSFEAWMLVVSGQIEIWRATVFFALPALAGNIVGGTALFALIAHAQVGPEL